MTKFKIGQQITVVYSHLGERVVLLLKVTKVGRKYLHGVTRHIKLDGTLMDGYRTKVDPEKSDIYAGFRFDITDAMLKHREEYEEWERQEHKKKLEYERDFYLHVKKRVAEWVVDNPAPQPPEFSALKEEAE